MGSGAGTRITLRQSREREAATSPRFIVDAWGIRHLGPSTLLSSINIII